MNGRPNYIQGEPGAQQGNTLSDTVVDMVAPKIMNSAMTAGANALATPASTAALGQAMGGTAVTGGMGAAMGAMAGPVGMAAMLALPYLFKNGTASVPGYMNGTQGVPEINYGPDPLQGYMNGTNSVPGYMNGTGSITPTTAMHLAGGKDSVPAMLAPGEAVIGSAAAQNPANIPDINRMLNETKSANLFAEGKDPNNFEKRPERNQMASMSGPLSGKTDREEMKVLQDMSLKKKAWEAEEMRKQKAFEQKLALDKQKALMSMQT